MKELSRLFLIAGQAPNAPDFIKVFEVMIEDTADIRKKIDGKDVSVENRQAVIAILKSMVDRLRNVSKNQKQRAGIEDFDI